MKRIFMTIIVTTIAINIYSQDVQDYMIIEKNDNSTLKVKINDVKRVKFQSETSSQVSTPMAVDMGLSVKWASFDLGSSNIGEDGSFFAWGEVSPRTGLFDWINYNHYNTATGSCKDIGNDISGTEYDAAKVLLGGNWRLPTEDEWYELSNIRSENGSCKHSKTAIGGKPGVNITGTNGDGIFIYHTNYWTSKSIGNSEAIGVRYAQDSSFPDLMKFGRYNGFKIRAVCDYRGDEFHVETGAATGIGKNKVTLNGNVIGTSTRVKVGFAINKSKDVMLTTYNCKTTMASTFFFVDIDNQSYVGGALQEGVTYYYRAWAEIDGKIYWGGIRSFTTNSSPVYKIGDYYPDSSNPEGIVFDVSYDGKTGMIVSLTSNGETYYSTAEKSCKNKGNGWRLPTSSELKIIANKNLKQDSWPNGLYWTKDDYQGYADISVVVWLGENTGLGFSNGDTGYRSNGIAPGTYITCYSVAVKRFGN